MAEFHDYNNNFQVLQMANYCYLCNRLKVGLSQL